MVASGIHVFTYHHGSLVIYHVVELALLVVVCIVAIIIAIRAE